ncbi:MAG: short-chain dehydrogenase/reductase SDR [Ignavibacteria bacterium]|nr:MAG: short-chain dehydrogenase/reductase SDR [Ignavibacteria bacterium]KAF0161296.1 MAG: short-chain dehydrogenase/reductase SDR [Ignavibacteria bacterium]
MTEKKKIVWLTGASSGIGKAIAEVFVANGILVAGSSRRIDLLNELTEKLGVLFLPIKMDVSDKSNVEEVYKKLSQEYEIVTLINNAGITSFKKIVDDSLDSIEQIIQTNLLGSVYTTKSVLPEMIERQSGTIINILSVVTQKIFTGSSAYSASKSGLLAFAKVVREELRDKNIRVINVSPGATATEIWPEKTLAKYSEKMMNAEAIAKLIFRIYEEKTNLVAEEIVLNPITGEL